MQCLGGKKESIIGTCFLGRIRGSSALKNLPANTGDLGSIPESGRVSGEGNGNPLQYSCLENSMDEENGQDTVHGVAKSWTPMRD